MNRARLRHALEVATNLAVLALCITLGIVVLRDRSQVLQSFQGSASSGSGALKRGDSFPVIENLKYSKSDRTLILALNTQCHFCRESLPFYRRLLAHQERSDHASQITAIFPNGDSEVREFIEEARLPIQAVARQDFAKLQIYGTPTLILLDPEGKVRNFWTGELPPSEEEEVIVSLRSSGS